MRIKTAIVSLSALATAACSSGAAEEDKAATAQAEFATCATKILQDAKIENPTAELTGKDFRVTGSLPASKGELEWQGKKHEADVSTIIVFSSVAGTDKVTASDTKRTSKVPVRPVVTETELPQDGKLQRGVNVSTVNWSLHACAERTHKPA